MDSLQAALDITVPTVKLREKIREYTRSHRYQLRANCWDSLRFGIGEIKAQVEGFDNLTQKDVNALAERIKRRKHATKDDIYRLSYAFLQDEKNIETFIKIPGALEVLIKEFTGKNSERQLNAVECLCNMSLGQSPVCDKISLFAGSYLVTYIHTTESQLVRLCLWTISNILYTGTKGALMLMQMQLLPQLWKLYVSDDVAQELTDFRVDAAICMQMIALNSEQLIKNEDRQFVLNHFVEKNPTCLASEYHLQIIFHILFSHPELIASFTTLQQKYLTSFSLSNICNTKEFRTPAERLKIIYSVRVLGNVISCHPDSYSMVLHQISINWQTNLASLLNNLFLFKNTHLTKEVLWLVKNILCLENSTNLSPSNFIGNLKIPHI